MTAGAIAEKFDVARPTISKHMQVLNECELITANQKGREIYYEIKVDKIKEIEKWLAQFRAIWENRYNQLDNLLSALNDDEKWRCHPKEEICCQIENLSMNIN